MIALRGFQNQKEPVLCGVDFSSDDVRRLGLKMVGFFEVVKQISSLGVPVQHGEPDKVISGLLGDENQIIGGEVKHDRSRRRPLARLWSSPGPATAAIFSGVFI